MRVRGIHAALIAAGYGGSKISRPDFDAAYATHVGKGTETLRRDIETGRVLGLWSILEGGPRRGSLRVHVTEDKKKLHEAAQPQARVEA